MRPPVDLERRERVLTQAPTRGGSHVVATTTALHIPKVEGGFLRIPWDQIDQASWRNDHLHLKTSTAEHHVGLTDPGSVPETVRERVTATIAFSHQAKLPHGGGVRIAGRRPATGGDIRWTFVFDAGLDPSDPGLRAQAEQLLEDLRRQTGL
ncbi:hypothetical protein ACGFNU_11250 [Spirillospora sp. NPDC048911]|uniref:hypothetical protein n=1 Tax=Spirillospora sp. NPDC048911 TaxID=3364527 RepID=UPI00371E0744